MFLILKKTLEEFNEIFYVLLTDDAPFLAQAKSYFQNFFNDPSTGISTPMKKKPSPFLEEEKSTVDTCAINKYSNLISESEVNSAEVNIQPFNKLNDAIEEENEEKTQKTSHLNIDDHQKSNNDNGQMRDLEMKIDDDDVISHLLSNGKL